MAKKKIKKRVLSAPRTTTKLKRRRRTRRKKGGMLSEFFTPQGAAEGGKAVLSGFIGGAASTLIDKALPNQTNTMLGLYKAAGGFIFATILKMPNVGAGMAGAGGAQFAASVFGMAEDSPANYANEIEALPMFLDENGDAVNLSEANDMLAEGQPIYNMNSNPIYPGMIPNTNII